MASNPLTVSIYEADSAGELGSAVANGELIHPGVVVADGPLLNPDANYRVIITDTDFTETIVANTVAFAGGVAWLDLAENSQATPSPVVLPEDLLVEVESFGPGPNAGAAQDAFVEELRLRFQSPDRARPSILPGRPTSNKEWIGCTLWGLFCSKSKS